MAISTDTVVEFFGTKTTVVSTGLSIGSSLFGSSASLDASWTNSDDAPMASVVFTGTWNTAPAPGASLLLYARRMNIGINSTSATIPSTAYKHPMGAIFAVATSTAVQVIPAILALQNSSASQVYEFYPKNQASQSLSSGWTLAVTAKTHGPSTG